MAWGGTRPGAGRKPKDDETARLHGSRQRVRGKPAKRAPRGPLDAVDIPADLSGDERAVWLELAPHAVAARTLVPASVFRFRRLCSLIVLARRRARVIQADGETIKQITTDVTSGEQSVQMKAHPLLSRLESAERRIDGGLSAFGLAPYGKPLQSAQPQQPADPFDEFDELASIQ